MRMGWTEQRAKDLVLKREKIEKGYLGSDVPIWPLQVAGSRVDEFLYRSPDEQSSDENFERARHALDQARDYATGHREGQTVKCARIEIIMRTNLQSDIPEHYLLNDDLLEILRSSE